jgi:hypothetical protein
MTTNYVCIVYLADGKHISQVERCESATEAKSRAKAWRAVGHIAKAYREVVDAKRCEIHHYPLV